MNVFKIESLKYCALLSLSFLFVGCSPSTAEELLNEARDYLAADEPRSAVIELKNVLQVEPGNAEAQLLLGQIYVSMGDFPLALRELEGAADSGIAGERVQKLLLYTKTQQGRFREVIGELEDEPKLDTELEVILGEAYLAAKDHNKAKEHFDKALILAPKNGRAAAGLAISSAAKGNIFDATGHYSDAVLWNPDIQELWIQKGNFELASQNADLALESFTKALELDGPSHIANLGIARCNIALGKMDDAEAAINKVLTETKKIPAAYYIKAQILFQKKQYTRADKVLNRALKIAPNYLAALYLKAAINYQEERFNLAIGLLRSLLKAHPDSMQVRILLSTSQFREGDAKTALATLESHADDIETSSGLALLGSLYLQNDQPDNAVRSFSEALALDPANNKIRTQLAMGYLASGDNAKAVEELQRAAANGGESIQDDVLLVLVKLRDGDLDAALLEAQKFQMRHPDSVNAYNLLGSVYLAQSNTEAAKAAFEKATELDTGYSPAVFNLAKIASSSGDVEGARTLYRNFLTANPDNIEAHIALGQLELAAGNLKAATNNFNRAVELDISVNGQQKIAKIPFELGRVELKNKNVDLARDHFNSALDISSGTHKQALLALIQIERVAGNRDLVRTLFTKLKVVMPESVIYYMMLAEFQLGEKNLDSAKANFKKAADLKHRGATLRYSGFLASNNEIDKAITVLEDWVSANSADLPAIATLGGYYLKEEVADKAIRVYENLDVRSPNNASVLNNLAWAYYLAKDDRAEAVARKAYDLSPDNAHMADTLGWILVQNNRSGDALKIFDNVLDLETNNASIYYHAAVAYSRSNRARDARTSLEKALALGKFPERSEAENLLNKLNI